MQMLSAFGMENMQMDLQRHAGKHHAQAAGPPAGHRRRSAANSAWKQETEALIDRATVVEKAVDLVENQGIIFLDELDKVCGPASGHGPDVSRQGVQRDLLPVVEGTTVNTKYGPVRTDHILFIAAGAFHLSKPADLMPELQGRFPIRVELTDLTRDDFLRILTEPKHAITKQYAELLATEGVTIEYTQGRHRSAGGHRLRSEPHSPEHRRSPAAHDPGARRRGSQLPRPRPAEQARANRRQLRPRSALGDP